MALVLGFACTPQPSASPPDSRSPETRATNQWARAEASLSAQPSGVPTSVTIQAFAPQKVWSEASAMGTHLAFAAYTTTTLDAPHIRKLFDDAVAEIKRLETKMTTWKDDSELSQINRAAGKEPVSVSDETREVIEESLKMSVRSSGTFDITFETLHGLWKFDQDLDPHPPKEARLRDRLKFVGYKHVKVDAEKKTVFIDNRETRISLGGIAKGYAVDRAVAVLDKAGLTSFFVQAGGDLFARGKKPDGSDWAAGVRDPRGPSDKLFALLGLSDHAFSTAGDYERAYIVGGKRYHHIIDPRTGYPATACRSVTIWAPTAFLADAIDDAVFILGPDKGMKLVDETDGVGAVIVDAKNNVWVSKTLRDKLRIVGVPSDGI